jgi:lipocalin-like protein
MKSLLALTFATSAALAASDAPGSTQASPLQGTWVLVAADKILPNGERARDYGQSPKGRLIVDAQGRYSLQIFKSERLAFASGDKAQGSADEYASAALGSSTHYGTVVADAEQHILTFKIEGASFPNWEGASQTREYTLKDGVLTYRVPPRADGAIPISVWKRLE